MPRSYSRRKVLLAVGTAGTTGVTGCLNWLTRSSSDSRELSISGVDSGHTANEFRAYVDRMRDRYGPHGVWGVRNGKNEQTADASEQLTFVGAWSNQWVLGTSAEDEGIHVPIDVAGVLYRVADEQQRKQSHRLWLWSGAIPTQPDDGVGSTTLTTLSVGVNLKHTVLDSYSPTTSIGPDDAPIRIGLDDDLRQPQAHRRLPAGRIQPNPKMTSTGQNGAFALDWSGGYGDTISVAGVCELRRQPDRDYELTVTSDASASQGTL